MAAFGTSALNSLVPGAGTVLSAIGSLFGGGVDPRIAKYIKPAIAQGNLPFLYAWVNTRPPHPTDSVQAALKGIAQLTGGTAYGGRLTSVTQSTTTTFSPAGYLPATLSTGQQIAIPYGL